MLTLGGFSGIKGITGAGLTSAEEQTNEFNASEAVKSWERSEVSADNAMERTRELRQTAVGDMVDSSRSAGINPYFALSGGASTGSVSGPMASSAPASGASPGGSGVASLLSAIGSMMMAGKQMGVLDAQKDALEADASNKRAEALERESNTRVNNVNADFLERTLDARVEAESLKNDISRATEKQIYKAIDQAESSIKLQAEQAQTEESKRILNMSSAVLNNARAQDIVLMRPFLQAEFTARTEQERAAAKHMAVAAAYQQGLIDSGMIEAAVRETNSSADASEAKADYDRTMKLVNSGQTSKLASEMNTLDAIDAYLFKALDALNPISNLVKR